jgi:predicted transcriptional regulator
MMNQTMTDRGNKFGKLVESALLDANLTQEQVAAEAGMHRTTLYRTIKGRGVSKSKVLAVIRATNRAAMSQVIDESTALKAAGFEANGRAARPNERLIASIVDNVRLLPESVQEDVLEMVQALNLKYKK